MNYSKKLVFIIIVSSLFIFHRLDEATLVFDDCYYGAKVKEMILKKNYLVPTYNFNMDVHDGKPILYYWLILMPVKFFGPKNFAMRLTPAICGFLGVILVFVFVSKYFNPYVGFISSFVLAFTQQYLRHARTGEPDIPFTLFFTIALITFWVGYKRNKLFYYYLTGIFTGLAVMTRNLPGFFVFLIIITFVLLSKETKILKTPHFYFSVLCAFLIVLPWNIWMTSKFGLYFLKSHYSVIFNKMFLGETGLHTPWYTIIGRILETYWPWLPFLIVGFKHEIKSLYSDEISSEEKKKILFLISWFFVPFIIFNLSKLQGAQYIMPIYVPAAIIVARVFDRFTSDVKAVATRVLVILSVVIVVLYLLFPIAPKTLDLGHYSDLVKIISTNKEKFDEVKEIICLNNRNSIYFSNGIKFYTDKSVVSNDEIEIKKKILSDERYYFIFFEEDFLKMLDIVSKEKIKIIAHSGKIIFFHNK